MSQCSAQLGSNSASIESKVLLRTFPKYDYADYAHIAIPNHKPNVSLEPHASLSKRRLRAFVLVWLLALPTASKLGSQPASRAE